MAEYREVHTTEDVSSNSSAVIIFIVAVIALLAVGLMMWQPWSGPSTTTVITQPQDRGPDTTIVNPPSNTTIINPPAESPKTEINIENKTEPPPTTGTTGETGTTGG